MHMTKFPVQQKRGDQNINMSVEFILNNMSIGYNLNMFIKFLLNMFIEFTYCIKHILFTLI